MKNAVVISFVLLTIPAAVSANMHPNLERGLVPSSMMRLNGPDNVNLFNGNLTLAIPLGQAYSVSDTLSYSFTMRYNSNVWDFVERQDDNDDEWVQAHPVFSSNAGMGWTLSLGDLLAPGSPRDYGNSADAWVYLAPDGSSHRFYRTLHEGESVVFDPPIYYTRDGSYLRMTITGFDTGDSPNEITVETPFGNTHTFDYSVGDDLWRLVRIEDQFGNFVVLEYFPDNLNLDVVINDSTGRQHQLSFFRYDLLSPVRRYRLSRVTLAAFDEGQACFDFDYTSGSIPRSRKHTDDTMAGNVEATWLRRITFPDGSDDPCDIGGCTGCSTADFEYNYTLGFGDPNDLPGTLGRMRLPTGGEIEWTYQTYKHATGDDFCNQPNNPANYDVIGKSTGIGRRVLWGNSTQADGEWVYVHSEPTGTDDWSANTTVTLPDGTAIVSYFNTEVERCDDPWRGWAYGLPFAPSTHGSPSGVSKKIYGADNLSTPIRWVSASYDHDLLIGAGYSAHYWYNTNRRMASRTTTYLDDSGGGRSGQLVPRYESVAYSNFDGLGHYREAFYSGNFAGEPDQQEFSGFNPAPGGAYRQYSINPNTNQETGDYVGFPVSAPWILGTLDLKTTSTGSEENRVEFCFDRSQYANGLWPTTGFLEGLRVHTDEDPFDDDRYPHDIIKTFADNSTWPGRVVTERYFGADSQNLPTASNSSACEVGGLQPVFLIENEYAHGALRLSRYRDYSSPP